MLLAWLSPCECEDCICLLLSPPLDSEVLEGRDYVPVIPSAWHGVVTSKQMFVVLMDWSKALSWVFCIRISATAFCQSALKLSWLGALSNPPLQR